MVLPNLEKFEKEDRNMTPVLSRNIACYGMKFLRISGHLSGSPVRSPPGINNTAEKL